MVRSRRARLILLVVSLVLSIGGTITWALSGGSWILIVSMMFIILPVVANLVNLLRHTK